MTTRKDVIEKALAGVYLPEGKKSAGTQVESLAKDIESHWEELQSNPRRDFEQELTNKIWMWYSGGGTAAIAASRVILAVELHTVTEAARLKS